MEGISSRQNDRFIGLQLKRNSVMLRQQALVQELNEQQLASFVENYRRMVMYKNDFKDAERFAAAMAFESEVAAWLAARFPGIEHYRESELRTRNVLRQRQGYKALPTPDFLLKTPIELFGKTVNWLECKNYYASTDEKMQRKLGFIQTAVKYKKYYGSGAMLFKFGFNKDLKVPKDVTFLDFDLLLSSS